MIWRTSFVAATSLGGVVASMGGGGRQVEEISEFGDDEFDGILQCSYQRRVSVDEMRLNVNDPHRGPITGPNTSVYPARIIEEEQHHEDLAPPASDPPAHNIIKGRTNDSAPPSNNVNYSGNRQEQPPNLQQQQQTQFPAYRKRASNGDRSIMSQIHLLPQNDETDDMSELPNDDVIYDRAHGISNKLRDMLRDAADIIDGDCDDNDDDVSERFEDGIERKEILAIKERHFEGKDGLSGEKMETKHDASGGSQNTQQQNSHDSGSKGSAQQSLHSGGLSQQVVTNKSFRSRDSSTDRAPNAGSEQKDALQAANVHENASDDQSRDSRKSLYAAILARQRMEQQSQSSADSKSMGRSNDCNEKAPHAAPAIPSSIAQVTSIGHSLSELEIESISTPSSITRNSKGDYGKSEKPLSSNGVSLDQKVPRKNTTHIQGKSSKDISSGDVPKDMMQQDALGASEGSNRNNSLHNPQDGAVGASMKKSSQSMKVNASFNLAEKPSADVRPDGNSDERNNNIEADNSKSSREEKISSNECHDATSSDKDGSKKTNNILEADCYKSSREENISSSECYDATRSDKEGIRNDSSVKKSHLRPMPSSITDDTEESHVTGVHHPTVNIRKMSEECLDSSHKTDVISNTSPPKGRPDFSYHQSTNVERKSLVLSFSVDDTTSLRSDISSRKSQSSLSFPDEVGETSFDALAQLQNVPQQHNGWNVPLGVHKIVCSAPGLIVTNHIHRGSSAVKVGATGLIIRPGSYVDILETRVHGKRVRGRICWEIEEEGEDHEISHEGRKKGKKKLGIMPRRHSMLNKHNSYRTMNKKRNKRNSESDADMDTQRKNIKSYEGWISLQWANSSIDENGAGVDITDFDESAGNNLSCHSLNMSMEGNLIGTDEDLGPWTEPVPLGVYRINSKSGPIDIRQTSEPDSAVLFKIHRGRSFEVVQTQVRHDGVVRARVFAPNTSPTRSYNNHGIEDYTGRNKFTSGWINLLNARSRSPLPSDEAAASAVSLGAYIVVADDPGCVITEGGQLDSKVKGTLSPGSCMEIVATRLEESGVVRGLIAEGGHVTLLIPPRGDGSKVVSFDDQDGGRKNANIVEEKMLAMPVPTGMYRIMEAGVFVTTGMNSSTSPGAMELALKTTVEIGETHAVRVEDNYDSNRSIVRGRIIRAVIPKDGDHVNREIPNGWITLFEVKDNRMRMYAHPKKKQSKQRQMK